MASEKYLLDELSPEQRDAYEEHLFDCVECAGDAMLGATFVHRAKAILPTMPAASIVKPAPAFSKPEETRDWFAWLRPVVMVPVFASLIGIIAYQNLVTVPALQLAANEPQILPAATVLHGDTRSGLPVVYGDLVRGSMIEVEIPAGSGYSSYKFDFYNSAGRLIYTRTIASSTPAQDTQSIFLPGGVKQDTYRVALSGMTSTGETVAIQQQVFDLQVKK